MRSAVIRVTDVGHVRRLAASLAAAFALLIAALFCGVGVRLFVSDKPAWLAVALVGGLGAYVAWTACVPRRRDRWLLDRAGGLVAWIVALVLINYSLAKIFGGQFGPPMESELDTPLRELSGFQLTWRFFGYSTVYTLFIAGAQGGAALLLCFERTRLLGACLQAPIMANIAVLNVTHGIPVKLISAILLALILYLIAALGGRRLVAFFAGDDVAPRPRGPSRPLVGTLKLSAIVVYVALLCATWWTSRHRWYQPSPIHGTWEVVDVDRTSLASGEGRAGAAAIDAWQRVYFESYRAGDRHIGSARTPDGLVRFAYTVDLDRQAIRIQLPVKRLDGRLERDGRRLIIRGTFGDRPITIELSEVEFSEGRRRR